MDIYSFDFKPTSVAEARQALDTGLAGLTRETAARQGWARRTPSAQDQCLLPIVGPWMRELSAAVRPILLAKAYPRIVNRLCLLGTYSEEICSYLDELLLDSRGGRQGFAYHIVMELVVLRAHYQAVSARNALLASGASERRLVR